MDSSVELIGEVKLHGNADKLDLSKVLGFQCVTQRGLYQGGEKVVFIRPDAVLPLEPWAEDYRTYSPKRIKAVKLRGEWSEGIIVPFEILPVEIQEKLSTVSVGEEVSEILGVTHYEPPVPTEEGSKRVLPYDIPKTDEERWENIVSKLPYGELVDATLKVDGQSWSIFYHLENDEFGVLGRRLEYDADSENRYSFHLFRTYPTLKEDFINFCKTVEKSLVLRGESYGSGIQNGEHNHHSKLNPAIAIFSVYIIEDRTYAHKGHELYFKNVAAALNIPTVEFVEENVVLTTELLNKYSVEQEKINGNYFEGVVIKHSKGSFKIISKKYDSLK